MEGSYWVGDLLSTGRVSRDRRKIRLVWSLSLYNPDTVILGRAVLSIQVYDGEG